MPVPFVDELRDLIMRHDAIEDATARACAFLRTADRSLYNEAILHAAESVDLGKQLRRGAITSEQHVALRKQLRGHFLAFLDEVERASGLLRFPFAQEPVDPRWPAGGAPEVIVGDNRLQPIAWLRRGLDASRSVCRITTSHGVGSGFLVAGGVLVTNHHVLPDAARAASAKVELNVEEGADGAMLPSYIYACDASTWKSSAMLDCAMVKVAPPAGGVPEIATWGALAWAPAAAVPSVGDYVAIIQHPSGGPKRIAISENQVVNRHEHRLQYTTDTMPGSSGSPVLDDAWRVVAVHSAGGKLVTTPGGERRYINEGILAEHVRTALGLSGG